jgi:prepilin-type N-terminal cleavage/methylation domain-containing protein
MPHSARHERDRGFSLLELLIVVAILVILAAVTVPRTLNAISDISLRYTAQNLSGLLQSARMQAVRKNTFYSVEPATLPSGDAAYYVNIKGGTTYTAGDPVLPLNSQFTVSIGPGSGAPSESFFTSGANINPGTDDPSFNARGLPCKVNGNSCAPDDKGFAIFVSKSALTGNIAWAAVIVTTSGHIQVWTYDNSGNWIQRD